MGEVAPLPNAQIPEKYNEIYEETGNMAKKNKINLQKLTLMKWKSMNYMTKNLK